MVNKSVKVVCYKILGIAPITEIEKIRRTIETEAKMIGLEVLEDKNPDLAS